jgi:hypothetical protein
MPRIFFASKRKNETNLSPFGQPRKKRKEKKRKETLERGVGATFQLVFQTWFLLIKTKRHH